MSHRNDELDVATAVAAHLLLGYLYTTTVADNAFVTNALVLAAGALIVASRTEDALAEQTVALGLVRTIVDGLRLGDLTIRIFENLLRRSESDGNLREVILYLCIFFESHISIDDLQILGYTISLSRASR